MRTAFLNLAFAVCCVTCFAQAHQHTPEPDQAKVDLSKLPAPKPLQGIGHAHITITTKSAQAQQWFDQGLALMHCFWDYEAMRAFEQAVREDADCAMCHWGLAQALDFRGGDKDQSKDEMKKAQDLAAKASDHEQRYIRAYAALDEKNQNVPVFLHEENDSEFGKQMEALIDRYPDDIEAKLLYAGSLNRGYDKEGKPRTGSLYGQSMLRELVREHPDNAAANHYWIHAVEGSGHPEWALESAQRLGSLAPNSGHMVHMPGHIFYRVGDYERARQIFLDAMHVDQNYMAAQGVKPANDWNYAHNISYLIADCAEEGRYAEAREYAPALKGLANDPDRSGNPGFYVFQIGPTTQRLAIRFGDWDYAAENPVDFGIPDDKLSIWARGYRDGLLAYARGMKAAESGQIEEAQRQSSALDAQLWRLSKEKLEGDDESRRDRVLKILGTASLELRGDIAGHKGDLEQARKLLDRATDEDKALGYAEPPTYSRPPLEVLGEVLINARKFSAARETYSKDLEMRPKSGFALYGIALAWEKEGNHEQATKAYSEFLKAWAFADTNQPQIVAAKKYLSTQVAQK